MNAAPNERRHTRPREITPCNFVQQIIAAIFCDIAQSPRYLRALRGVLLFHEPFHCPINNVDKFSPNCGNFSPKLRKFLPQMWKFLSHGHSSEIALILFLTGTSYKIHIFTTSKLRRSLTLAMPGTGKNNNSFWHSLL